MLPYPGLNIEKPLAQLLVQRGITTFDEAKTFFRPDLANLHDPFLMKDMDVAVQRIHEAIESGEKVMIYGDYDVDGPQQFPWSILFSRTILKTLIIIFLTGMMRDMESP